MNTSSMEKSGVKIKHIWYYSVITHFLSVLRPQFGLFWAVFYYAFCACLDTFEVFPVILAVVADSKQPSVLILYQ